MFVLWLVWSVSNKAIEPIWYPALCSNGWHVNLNQFWKYKTYQKSSSICWIYEINFSLFCVLLVFLFCSFGIIVTIFLFLHSLLGLTRPGCPKILILQNRNIAKISSLWKLRIVPNFFLSVGTELNRIDRALKSKLLNCCLDSSHKRNHFKRFQFVRYL